MPAGVIIGGALLVGLGVDYLLYRTTGYSAVPWGDVSSTGEVIVGTFKSVGSLFSPQEKRQTIGSALVANRAAADISFSSYDSRKIFIPVPFTPPFAFGINPVDSSDRDKKVIATSIPTGLIPGPPAPPITPVENCVPNLCEIQKHAFLTVAAIKTILDAGIDIKFLEEGDNG